MPHETKITSIKKFGQVRDSLEHTSCFSDLKNPDQLLFQEAEVTSY